MLLLHTSNISKVGDIHRYTLTYAPPIDRTGPPPTALYLRIKNTAPLPFRAAYLHGPYTLYVSVRRKEFQPWPSRTPGAQGRDEELRVDADMSSEGGVGEGGIPEFDPNLKAGASFYATLPLPAELIEDALRNNDTPVAGLSGERQQVVYDSKRRRSVTWIVEVVSQAIFSINASVSFEVLLGEDEKCLNTGYGFGSGSASPRPVSAESGESGVLHKALQVRLQGTRDLWNIPAFPSWGDEYEIPSELDPDEQDEERERSKENKRKRKTKKVHLVIVTHGLHSNTGADMLFMKEAIDEEYRKGEIAAKETAAAEGTEFNEDDREMVIVRGFHENVCRTERGIKFLGRRLAKYVLNLVNPNSPPPSPATHKLQKSRKANHHPHLSAPPFPTLEDIPPYEITSISFVGHSLGGLIQTYAIAYIHAHAPDFFTLHKPFNFVALATPFLGLSNENPIYVKFALDFGLVGRTGQDLGLTWRAPFPLPTFAKQSNPNEADTSKPLLRILPTGPAHDVLSMFRNRTVYANVVNDGIVPLRTSCLLFLDWKGLGKVEKARRENGAVGGLVGWGWGQLTNGTGRGVSSRTSIYGAGSSAGSSPTIPWFSNSTRKLEEKVGENRVTEAPKTGEPTRRETESGISVGSHDSSKSSATASSVPNPFTSILALFRPQVAKRSTIPEPLSPPSPDLPIPPNLLAPPRTSILEAAGDVLNPPLPSPTFILDPHSRPQTIFHDRIYSAADIPQPSQSNPLKVEEKIARAYHAGVSWRKVLVRLEPDAHNNLIVRRMFANAYGWPVVQHLAETHFGASYTAATDNVLESHRDQADVAGDEDIEVDSASPIKRHNRSSTESSAQWSDRAFLVSDDEDEPTQNEGISAFLGTPAATTQSDSRAHKTPCPAEVAKVAVLASTSEELGGLGISGVSGGVGLASSGAVRMLRGNVEEGVAERVARLGFN
ncbi:putative serine esterase-domain-containing protein [Tuber brumale]|nr:putative serine esterase-domain-containing protein [Tuber brumale]